MANHSLISLKKPVAPEAVEQAVTEINQRRFGGRMRLLTRDTAKYTERVWELEAPDTRPKEPGPCNPDENLGFYFCLNEGGQHLEVRHVIFNPWIRWVQDVLTHELAKHFGVKRFNGGDGFVQAQPERFCNDFYGYAIREFPLPLSSSDSDFVRRHFLDKVPETFRP